MKIAIVFDGASAIAAFPDLLILDTVEAIERAMVNEGNGVTRIPVHPDGRWIERLSDRMPELSSTTRTRTSPTSASAPSGKNIPKGYFFKRFTIRNSFFTPGVIW